MPNIEEYRAGTNPLDAKSTPAKEEEKPIWWLYILIPIIVVVIIVCVLFAMKGKKPKMHMGEQIRPQVQQVPEMPPQKEGPNLPSEQEESVEKQTPLHDLQQTPRKNN